MDKIKLPMKPRKALSVDPSSLLIYAPPKLGKSTIMADLTTLFAKGKSVILSTEPNGYDHLDANVIDITSPPMFNSVLDEIEKEKPYEYLIIDSLTKLDEWSEIVGTFNYMNTSQGRNFNVIKGEKIGKNHPLFETVHDIGQGYGYKHSRAVMVNWVNRLMTLAPKVIFIAHVKDKMLTTETGEMISSTAINLTGKLGDIIPSKVSAVAKLIVGKKGDESSRYLSFSPKAKDSIMGSRARHLNGVIKISEDKEGKITTFWNQIFIN